MDIQKFKYTAAYFAYTQARPWKLMSKKILTILRPKILCLSKPIHKVHELMCAYQVDIDYSILLDLQKLTYEVLVSLLV